MLCLLYVFVHDFNFIQVKTVKWIFQHLKGTQNSDYGFLDEFVQYHFVNT